MYKFVNILVFLFAIFACYGQGINSKSIEINNKLTEHHRCIPGTRLKMVLPPNFELTDNFNYEDKETGSRIAVQEFNSDINTNIYAFSKGNMFQVGVVVMKETFFKINGYEAIIIEGQQFIDNKQNAAAVMLIGDYANTYMILAVTPIPIQNDLGREFTKTLLSVIYTDEIECPKSNYQSFSVDVIKFGLTAVKGIDNTLCFSDDGNFPSRTDEKVTLTIKEYPINQVLSDEQKKLICSSRYKVYPLTYNADCDTSPKPFTNGKYAGYEIYASGKSQFADNEFIYQLILFDSKRIFVITGMCMGSEDENLQRFRDIAGTLE